MHRIKCKEITKLCNTERIFVSRINITITTSRFIAKYKYNDFVLSWRNNVTTSRHQWRKCVGDSWRCSLNRESGILPLSHCRIQKSEYVSHSFNIFVKIYLKPKNSWMPSLQYDPKFESNTRNTFWKKPMSKLQQRSLQTLDSHNDNVPNY